METVQPTAQETRTRRSSQASPKKKMKKGFKALLICVGVLTALLIAFIVFVLGGKDAALNAQIGDVNLAVVDDGVYTGGYAALRFSSTVEVTVRDHQIADIRVTVPQVVAKPERSTR